MMFSIRLAYFEPLRQPTRRRLRTSQDFSAKACDYSDAQRAHAFGPFPNPVRALIRIAGKFTRHLLKAMYESRRKQAMAVLSGYHELMNAPDQTHAPVSQMCAHSRDGTSFGIGAAVAPVVYAFRIRRSITGTPCEGDHVHLGDEWAFLGDK